ncbi:MAG: hypothetical protein EBR41_05165, partial [Crocinitomicaceae bacterium]|nr:hypothetical protein [Crocinitomicaceae bacterium]
QLIKKIEEIIDSQKIIRKYAENVNKKLSSAPPKFYRLIWSDDEKKNFTMHIQNYLISPNSPKRGSSIGQWTPRIKSSTKVGDFFI